MVWFQCEDCGDNLKKPKLPSHFRVCSAHKLSCIDCGAYFTQESVQSHTQCVSEVEKYGPKGAAKAANSNSKTAKNECKANADIDVHVGLSSSAPWSCSLCKTTATSHQALLQHAEGKKHRAKAWAFHAAMSQPQNLTKEISPNNMDAILISKEHTTENGLNKVNGLTKESDLQDENLSKNKRKVSATEKDETRGKDAVREAKIVKECFKRKKLGDLTVNSEQAEKKFKWKRLIKSILKSDPEGALRLKKLQKLVSQAIQGKHVVEDGRNIENIVLQKVETSSRLILDKKFVRLAPK